MWRRAAAAAALAGLWLVATGAADPAGAHAMLRGSDPAGGASLDRSPAAVTLHFTEAPDPALSVVHVLDTAGHAVSTGPAVALAGSRLRAPLPVLGAGTYTVTWRATSRVDGHVSQGAFAFGASAGVPLGRFLGSGTGHWLEARGGAVLLAAAAVAGLLLAGSGWGAKAPQPVPAASRASATAWLVALGVAASAGLLVHALAGHAAAPGPLRLVNLGSQWLHLLAVAVWIGGLAWLLAGIAGRPRAEMGRAAVRFSKLAAWSLLLVALSGLERAAQLLGGWSHLLGTSFGRTLDVKLGLFAVLVALGTLNRFRVVPALAAGNGRLAWLRRTVRGELVVASGVLLAAALLSELPPGSDAPGARAATPPQPAVVRVSGADYTTAVRVTLQVSPGSAGPNRFVATVADYDTGRTLLADHVRLSATLPARPDVAAAELDLTRAADGSWHGQGAVLTIAGTWAITTLVERPDDGVEVPIELHVGASPVS